MADVLTGVDPIEVVETGSGITGVAPLEVVETESGGLVGIAPLEIAEVEEYEPPEVEEPETVFTGGTASGDVRLAWANGVIDATIEGDDIGADLGMQTAMILSLFTDRRAEADDPLPSEDGDRRGWWADEFAEVEGDLMGSRLWLLARSARRPGVDKRAKEYVAEALAWMIEDHVAASLDIEVGVAGEQLQIAITVHRPGQSPVTFRFAHVWDGEAARA